MRQLQSYSALPANPKEKALSPLAKKLRLKPEHRFAVLNSPPGYLAFLEPGPTAILTEVKPDETYDAVQLFANDAAELEAMKEGALGALKPDGLLWVCRPSGTTTNEDIARVFRDSGFKPIAFVKIDEAWATFPFKKP